jgi:type I restriction enzyme S subunit
VTSGGTPSRKNPEFYTNGPIGWVKTKELADGFISQTEESITADAVAASSAKLLPKDTILLAMYGATVGMLGILAREMACNQACCALLVKPEFDRDFLFYQLLAHREQLEGLATGAAQQNLSGQQIKELIIPFPPLEEQKAIGSYLRILDDRITLLRETNTTLEAIAQALFKSWFVDFDPVHAKMQGLAPEGMDEATAALFPDSFEESELGPVPKGWKTITVGDSITPKRGKSITKTRCIDGDVPVVAGGLEPAYFHNQSNVSNPVVTISASGANAGFVRLYQQAIWASDCSFVSEEQTDSIYFWYVFLRSNQDNIYFMQQGAAQPHIYPSDLMRLNICMPESKNLGHLFHKFVTPLFEKIGSADAKIQTLSKVRETLLPRLISGQLSLTEVAVETI